MTIIERSEILTSLYKLKADTAALYVKCQGSRCLTAGMLLETYRDAINDEIESLEGRQEQFKFGRK